MTDNGRLTDVLIEDQFTTDPATGIKEWYALEVWADAGNSDVIQSVPGVANVFSNLTPTQYKVYLDPRYDREWVKAEIEAAIKIGAQ